MGGKLGNYVIITLHATCSVKMAGLGKLLSESNLVAVTNSFVKLLIIIQKITNLQLQYIESFPAQTLGSTATCINKFLNWEVNLIIYRQCQVTVAGLAVTRSSSVTVTGIWTETCSGSGS